jgi:PAS domain S-box-containing protein
MNVPPDEPSNGAPTNRPARPAAARWSWSGGRAPEILDSLVDSSPIGIGFWNTDLRYERINAALARINGATVEDHLGRTPEEVMGEMGRHVEHCLLRAVQTRRPVVEVEVSGRVRGHGDRVQHRQGSWFPVLDDAGDVVGIGGVVRDVTERHELEEERSRLLQEAITQRAHAQAAQVRSAAIQEEAELARREAEAARREAERAQRDAQLARDRTQFLLAAGARIRASLEVGDALRELARVATTNLADCCFITTVNGDGSLETEAVGHADPSRLSQVVDLIERHPPRADARSGAGRVIATGVPEMLPELGDGALVAMAEDAEHLELLRANAFRSSLVLPLRTSGVTLGALTLLMVDSGRRFSEDDFALGRALADQASLHIRNAQLYTERSHIARTLQASLRPGALPAIPGIEVAARYRAAGPHNDVGGDFYDVFHTDDDAWTVLLGDVSGKGAEAAAVTSLARHTLRTASLYAASPAGNLTTLNRALLAEANTTRFCTAICARIVSLCDHARVTLANGGHLAPRIVRGGRVTPLEVSGTLVGAIADAHFDEVEIRLERGDAVLLYTDGVTEVRTPGRDPDYGERELDRTLASLVDATAEQMVEAVSERAMEMHEHQPRDDMALVALRVIGR